MDEELLKDGAIDFDKLNILEREQYMKALQDVATSQITLEDWKGYISRMREAVEMALVDEPQYIHSERLPFLKRDNPKFVELKMRLKNYLIFERFFMKADAARLQLEMYNKRLNLK